MEASHLFHQQISGPLLVMSYFPTDHKRNIPCTFQKAYVMFLTEGQNLHLQVNGGGEVTHSTNTDTMSLTVY